MHFSVLTARTVADVTTLVSKFLILHKAALCAHVDKHQLYGRCRIRIAIPYGYLQNCFHYLSLAALNFARRQSMQRMACCITSLGFCPLSVCNGSVTAFLLAFATPRSALQHVFFAVLVVAVAAPLVPPTCVMPVTTVHCHFCRGGLHSNSFTTARAQEVPYQSDFIFIKNATKIINSSKRIVLIFEQRSLDLSCCGRWFAFRA